MLPDELDGERQPMPHRPRSVGRSPARRSCSTGRTGSRRRSPRSGRGPMTVRPASTSASCAATIGSKACAGAPRGPAVRRPTPWPIVPARRGRGPGSSDRTRRRGRRTSRRGRRPRRPRGAPRPPRAAPANGSGSSTSTTLAPASVNRSMTSSRWRRSPGSARSSDCADHAEPGRHDRLDLERLRRSARARAAPRPPPTGRSVRHGRASGRAAPRRRVARRRRSPSARRLRSTPAGRRIEPTVWVPIAAGIIRAATAAADPDDDPPGVCPRDQGLRVGAGSR